MYKLVIISDEKTYSDLWLSVDKNNRVRLSKQNISDMLGNDFPDLTSCIIKHSLNLAMTKGLEIILNTDEDVKEYTEIVEIWNRDNKDIRYTLIDLSRDKIY